MGVKNNSLSYFILIALEKSIDGYVEFDNFIHHPLWERTVKKSELSQALKRLRERGLIKENKIDTNELIWKLTELGREALGIETEEEWDGKWRMVIFDIPEQKRVVRNLFRRNLKRWGFKQLQQSVWVTRRNVVERLKSLVIDLKIEDWVAVVESDNVSFGNKILNGRTM